MPINLELDDGEQQLLLDILESRLGELREQVYHSETPKFRDGLKAEEALLYKIVEQVRRGSLGAGTGTVAA